MAIIDVNFLNTIDDFIRRGESEEARVRLRAVAAQSDIPRAILADFCALCRRVGELKLVLDLLHPLIRPSARFVSDANPNEIVEYAGALVRSGILTEAQTLLKTVDPKLAPRSLLVQSFAATALWDYETSNKKLDTFLNLHADPYEHLIAEVNLLQGLVFLERNDEASNLIDLLFKKLKPNQHKLLLAATYEFAAELERQNRKYSRALRNIEKGQALLTGSKTIDEFLLRKQKALINAWSTKDSSFLDSIRKEAFQRKHFESVRDCDLSIGLIERQPALVQKVYWGSSSTHFKVRVRRLAGDLIAEEDTTRYQAIASRKGLQIDLVSGRIKGENFELKPGQAMHRLWRTLLSDFYKPFRKLDLFEAVFPDELYFPQQSSDRIHQLIKRLRIEILKAELPITIDESDTFYRLQIKGAYSLLANGSIKTSWEQRLADRFDKTWFGINDVSESFDISWRTAHRRVSRLKEMSALETKGRTQKLKFRFVKT